MTDLVLTLDHFLPHLNEHFVFEREGGPSVRAELIEVNKSSSGVFRLEDTPREPFDIIFKLEDGAVFQSGTWEVSHETVGHHAIYLVQIMEPRQGQYIQAVFN